MQEIKLKCQTRQLPAKEPNLTRKRGQIPAELYGQGSKNQHLFVNEREFEKLYEQVGESSLITLNVGESQPVNVLVHEVQRDPITDKFLHVDFYLVNLDKEIETRIPLVFVGESEAVKYWCTHFYKETAQSRREKMFRPRAGLAAGIADRFGLARASAFADIGAGYGIFLEEVERLGRFGEIIAVEPSPQLADKCRERGFKVIQKTIEEISAGEVSVAFATSFEVLEHLYSPEEFLSAVRRILLPQGLLLITTLTVTGFDIQLLWEHSKSVYPPHHINLLSVEGMRRLFERAGFEVLELSTPGELDVDIVRNTVKEDPSVVLPRFIRYLTDDSRTELGASLQRFLQANLLSSHIRVIARKI